MEGLQSKQYSQSPPLSKGSLSSSAPQNKHRKKNGNSHSFEKDALTGLHGQKYLCRAIDVCLQQSRKKKLTATLALLQLENFYEIRTWVGLSEADLLLTDIAQLLKASLPTRAVLCRCHNFEFGVLLLADCSVNARLITDKLKQVLLSAVSPSLPAQLELNCGVGLAKLESTIPSWPAVFARARHNLSLATHHRELPAHLVSISPDIALKQLHGALTCPELKLNFQALLKLTDDPLEHYEVRCSLAQYEQSLPTILLFEVAAKNALGEQLDRRVIKQVLSRLSKDALPNRRLVISLSHNSLVSVDFLRWLEEKLHNRKALASQLILQISETDALIAQHHLTTFCKHIEKLGCGLCVSNFGCTPKPLRYLSLVPAAYVKLHIGLLEKIDANKANLDIVSSLIEELHKREISVITPAVEQLAILPILWQINADFMQGYCVHAPSTSMDFTFIQTQTVNFDAC